MAASRVKAATTQRPRPRRPPREPEPGGGIDTIQAFDIAHLPIPPGNRAITYAIDSLAEVLRGELVELRKVLTDLRELVTHSVEDETARAELAELRGELAELRDVWDRLMREQARMVPVLSDLGAELLRLRDGVNAQAGVTGGELAELRARLPPDERDADSLAFLVAEELWGGELLDVHVRAQRTARIARILREGKR